MRRSGIRKRKEKVDGNVGFFFIGYFIIANGKVGRNA